MRRLLWNLCHHLVLCDPGKHVLQPRRHHDRHLLRLGGRQWNVPRVKHLVPVPEPLVQNHQVVRLLPLPHRVPVLVLRDDRLANLGRSLLPVSNLDQEMTRSQGHILVHETVLYEIVLSVVVDVSERLLSLFVVANSLEVARLVLQDRSQNTLVVRHARDDILVINILQVSRSPPSLELESVNHDVSAGSDHHGLLELGLTRVRPYQRLLGGWPVWLVAQSHLEVPD